MDIGGALAAARSAVGLTVDQVSERTRIRPTIIRAIERDDYAVCGGDFYARGHIRAIARAVGTDPAPLIDQYDQAHAPPPPPPPPPESPSPHRTPGPWLHTLEQEPPRRGEPAASASDTTAPLGNEGHDESTWARPGGITAAEAFRPAMPLQYQGTRPNGLRRSVLTLVALAVIAIVGYLVAATGGAPAQTTSHHAPARKAQHTAAPHKSAAASAAPSARPSPTLTVLPIAGAAAFGPSGPSQGDNPSEAGLAVDGSNATAWHTDWYAKANLNGTQPGTGLLLDMGTSVTVSSVSAVLAPAAGGTVQLLAGNTPALASLQMVAQAANPGGTLTLQPAAPVTARYVVIWFTQLPPNNAGTYEAYVYNVSVSGTR